MRHVVSSSSSSSSLTSSRSCSSSSNKKAIDRVSLDQLSYSDFISKYAKPRKPVIIQGLKLTKEEWSLDFIKRKCGSKEVNLHKRETDSVEWGSLHAVETMTVKEFIDTHTTNQTRRSYYLHDWSLPIKCPGIFGSPPYDEFVMPKYFVNDYFQKLPFESYQHSWPSLFVGASGTQSDMHIDSGGTHFWMFLLSGRKDWRIFPRSDRMFLYETPGVEHWEYNPFQQQQEEEDVCSSSSSSSPSSESPSPSSSSSSSYSSSSPSSSFPLVECARVYHGIQEPGDLIFIPAGSPHAVSNIEDIHALSMNYVDATNFYYHLQRRLVDGEFRAFELFTKPSFHHELSTDEPLPKTFGEFKSQKRKTRSRS
mmetsp:Transcript_29290/g.54837  ORF Transcript_29290/g.54837 Transcript_29290/m.54837 type:complete len:366 (-) Transcript_29290:112-1209(-)